MAREVRVAILGDSRDFSRAVRDVQSATGRLDGAFSSIKRAALGMGAAFAGRELFELGKSFVDAATESKKVTAQTDAVIKSMGNTAGVTAAQVESLSGALSLKSGIDDELIQSGQNLLLTFGNVKNGIGEGNAVFDRATAAALDMSVALGTDMKAASMTVGKALNDPIRGMTTLRRSGIQFTQQQEDQIKAMVAVGDTAGAQKIMLEELERQFGGSAAAQATATSKMAVAWDNVKETLGTKLLPVVEKVATWLAANLPAALAAAGQAFDWMRPKIEAVVAFVESSWPKVEKVVAEVMIAVEDVVRSVLAIATTLWENFGDNILSFVRRVWPNIEQIISGAMEFIRGVILLVTSLIKGDWSAVWEGIKGILSGAWEAIQGIAKAAIEAVGAALGIGYEAIRSAFTAAWDGIVAWFWGLPDRVAAIANAAWAALKAGLKASIDWIIEQIKRPLGYIEDLKRGLRETFGNNLPGRVKAVTARAHGGSVSGGSPYLVGERGPELFMPRVSGTIIPNHRLATTGGGGPQTIIVQIGDEVVARVVANAAASGARRGIG